MSAGRARGAARLVLGLVMALTTTVAGAHSANAVSAPTQAPTRALTQGQLTESAPVEPPSVPVIASVIGDALSVRVAWLPGPAEEQATRYDLTATAVPGTPTPDCASPAVTLATAAGTSTSTWVTGLCAHVAYTVTMTATNNAGTSTSSDASLPGVAMPGQAPRAPAILDAAGRDGAIVLAWSPPTLDGGSPLTGYTLTARAPDGSVAASAQPAASAEQATLSGLTNGTRYSLALVARNALGSSDTATVSAAPRTLYVPSEPTGLTATPSTSGSVSLGWSQPSDDGGQGPTGYTVTWERVTQDAGSWVPDTSAATHTMELPATSTSAQVNSFEDSTAFYRFSVAARNGAGQGAPAVSTALRPVVTVNSSTVVLTDTTTAAVGSLTAGSVTWPAPAPAQVTALIPGNTIVAAATPSIPNGLMRKVVSISNTADAVTVTTTEASLDDVFTNMTMSTSVNPSRDTAPNATALPGVQPRFRAAIAGVQAADEPPALGVSASHTLKLDIELKDGAVFASGTATLTSETSVELGVSTNVAGVPDGVSVDAQSTVDFNLTGKFGISGTRSWTLGTYEGVPFVVTVGAVPIVIQPRLVVTLSAKGELSVGLKGSSLAGAAVHWRSSNPYDLDFEDLSHPFTATGGNLPGITATGDASVTLKAQGIAAIGGVAGPSVSVAGKLSGSVDFNPAPGQHFLEVGPQLEVKAGLALDRFGFHADLEQSVLLKTFAKFYLERPPAASYSIVGPGDVPAEAPASFTAVRSDGASVPVSWEVVGGVRGDTVTDAGLFTPSSPSGRWVTIMVTDGSGAGGTRAVLVGVAFPAPGYLRATQHADDLGLDVTWQPPTGTGGSPLASYETVVSGGGAPMTVPAGTTSLSVGPLATGFHTITVYARNTAGQLSAPATLSVYLTPPCTNTWQGTYTDSWTDASKWSKSRVPGRAEWVCLAGRGVHIPSGQSVTVAGLDAGQGDVVLDGSLSVSSYLTGISTLSGSGSFTAGPALRWTLPTLIEVDVVNRGYASLDPDNPTSELNRDAVLDNYGTLTSEGAQARWGQFAGSTSRIVNHDGATLLLAAGSLVDAPLVLGGTIETLGDGASTIYDAYLTATSAPEVAGPLSILNLHVPSDGALLPAALSGARVAAVMDGTLTVPHDRSLTIGSPTYGAYGQTYTFEPRISSAVLVNQGELTIDTAAARAVLSDAVIDNSGTLTLTGPTPFALTDGTTNRVVGHPGSTLSTDGGMIDVPVELGGALVNRSSSSTTLRQAVSTGPVTASFDGHFGIGLLSVDPSGSALTSSGDMPRVATIRGGPLAVDQGGKLDLGPVPDYPYCYVQPTLVNHGELRVTGPCTADISTNDGVLTIAGELFPLSPGLPVITTTAAGVLAFDCPVAGCWVHTALEVDGTLRTLKPSAAHLQQLTLTSASRTELTIGGGGSSILDVAYELALKGHLVTTTVPGYDPAPGESWSPVSGLPVIGRFDSIEGNGWVPVYTHGFHLEWPNPDLPFTVAWTPTTETAAFVGVPLTADPGPWQPAPDVFTYQWLRNEAPVPGATQRSYTPTPADVGTRLSVQVTGHRTGYQSSTQTSAPTWQVGLGSLATSTPTITGSPVVGSTLTASMRPWGPAPVTVHYQWFAGSSEVPGATAATYTLAPATVGQQVWVTVQGDKAGYDAAAVSSAHTSAVAPAVVTAPAPTFRDGCGTAKDALVIPVSDRVTYSRNGVASTAGTYAATGSIKVVATARLGYTLTGASTWSRTFSTTSCTATIAAPTLATPTATTPRVTATWSVNALPAGAGPAHFSVQSRIVGVTSTGVRTYSTPSARLTGTTAASAVLSGTAGTVYQFRVQASDAFGSSTAWSPWRTVTMPLDDRSSALVYSSGWTSATSSSAYAGTYRWTNRASSVRTTAWTDQVTIIGTRARTAGRLRIYVDGVLKATVDSYAATTTYRQSLASIALPYGKHTISVIGAATAGRPNVFLDAIALRR